MLLLPVIATALQFLMTLISMKATGNAAGSQGKMMCLMPLMTLWMGYILPAALCVYWIVTPPLPPFRSRCSISTSARSWTGEETDKGRAKRKGPGRQDDGLPGADAAAATAV